MTFSRGRGKGHDCHESSISKTSHSNKNSFDLDLYPYLGPAGRGTAGDGSFSRRGPLEGGRAARPAAARRGAMSGARPPSVGRRLEVLMDAAYEVPVVQPDDVSEAGREGCGKSG